MKKITVADPYFNEQDRERITKEIPSILDEALSMGKNVSLFEKEFAEKFSIKHAVAVNACTSALEIALNFLDLDGSSEVITPSLTFIATGMAVHLSGGKPVFAEVNESTFCLDFEDVKRNLSKHTKAVITVHFAGLISHDTFELKKFCDDHGIMLIEDAAHSPGAVLNGKYAGGIGHAGTFSFFPTKIITCGEGGMLTTNSDELADFSRSLQHRGRDLDAEGEVYSRPGRNIRMPEFSALLGRVQLDRMDESLAVRRKYAEIYQSALKNNPRIKLPSLQNNKESSFWKFPVELDCGLDRDFVMSKLHESGVYADKTYSPLLHLQPFFVKHYKTKKGLLPRTEKLAENHLCLPCHPRLSEEDIHFVINALDKTIGHGHEN